MGHRTILAVPLVREGESIGAIVVRRTEAHSFSEKQIALLQTFADQAVIAIGNVRLFDEVQARTRELTEALQQQTATADVLKVISRSAFDLQAVFDSLLGSAVALSGADSGVLAVRDGDAFRCKSFVKRRGPAGVLRLSRGKSDHAREASSARALLLSGRIEWIEDTLADSALAMRTVIARTNDDRALVGVPLLREGRIEGAIVLGRREPGRFGARAIELTQTFADQAVIAIENVRLFNEVQSKTDDLSEALQQQTATADVLKVISRSVFDLETVLQTLIDTAVRLGRGSRGTIFIRKGDVLVASAFHRNVPGELRDFLATTPWRIDGDSDMARAVRDRKVVHIPDLSQIRTAITSSKPARERRSGRDFGPRSCATGRLSAFLACRATSRSRSPIGK